MWCHHALGGVACDRCRSGWELRAYNLLELPCACRKIQTMTSCCLIQQATAISEEYEGSNWL